MGRGLCVHCYRVDNAKRKLLTEINAMSTERLFQIKRPELHHSYWSVNDREEIVEALLNKEDQKLYCLKLYGSIENGEKELDLLGFEELLNDLAMKFGKSAYFYNHKLNQLHDSLSRDQIRDLALQLLKMRLW
ncbi:MAG: hypothetical protein HYZ14_05340 [Bacteroidetes bacterium]|nr:hypothetical protein [Bacteroidota bacterium]